MLIALFFFFVLLSSFEAKENPPESSVEKEISPYEQYTRTITYYTQTSKDYYDRFTKIIYSKNMWYFEQSDSEKHKYYITNPFDPIEYVGYKYFFNETYMKLDNIDKVCEYRFHEYFDKKLLNTFYRNGTKPTSLLFTCAWFQQCTGLECKLDVPRLPYIFVLPLLIFAVYRYLRQLILREKLRAAAAAAAAAQTTPPAYSAPIVPSRNLDLPPSYSSVMSSPRSSPQAPPSYETVTRGTVQYTLPSAS